MRVHNFRYDRGYGHELIVAGTYYHMVLRNAAGRDEALIQKRMAFCQDNVCRYTGKLDEMTLVPAAVIRSTRDAVVNNI